MQQAAVASAFFGLRMSEWINLAAIIIGPLAAVAITIWHEQRRRMRESQTQILKMLINTRHLPADPMYQAAINLIPIEFNKSNDVKAQWIEYIRIANEEKDINSNRIHIQQTKVIFSIVKSLGYNLAETDIQFKAYSSDGFVKRDNLYLDSLVAMREIADALKVQTNVLQNAHLGSEKDASGKTEG